MMTHPLSPHLLKKDIWSPRFQKPQSLHYLTLSGSIEGGTLTMLVFPDQSKIPALALRLLRDESELPHFLNERDVLMQFQTLSSSLKNSVPKMLFCENLEGRWILGESVVEGAPLKNREELGLAFTWLKALAHETQKSSATGPLWQEAAEGIIAEFQKHFTVSADEQNFFRNMRAALRACGQRNAMIYLVHGDFSRHNLFISKTKKETALHVIDWMSARRSPFPLHDACMLLTTYPLQNRKGPGLQGYLRALSNSFFASNDFSRLAKRWLLGHCADVGLDPKLLPFFFGLFLMEQSVLEYKRILALSKKGYIPRGAIYRESLENYEQALKNQIWVEFFHFFVAHRSSFLKNA